MHDLVSYNGRIIGSTDARIPALSAAGLYGKGVFTTVAIYGGWKEWWYEHWLRISREARRLEIDISHLDVSAIGSAIDDLIERNHVHDGKARVTFFDERSTELWPTKAPGGTSTLIMTSDRLEPPEYFRLTTSPYAINSTSPLAGLKSCNYLERVLAKAEARARGFDECIQLNEHGEIVSAAMANVFWQKGQTIFTPSLRTGCVPGTTRLQVLESFQARKRMILDKPLDCVEVEMGITELESAEEIFLTSAGLGFVQVAEFEGRKLEHDESHALVFGFQRIGEHKNTQNRSE